MSAKFNVAEICRLHRFCKFLNDDDDDDTIDQI
jgi:hypothetical protein